MSSNTTESNTKNITKHLLVLDTRPLQADGNAVPYIKVLRN